MKKKSNFLSGMGKAFEIFRAIVNAVLDIGGDDSDLIRILTDSELRKQIANLVVKPKRVISDVYPVFVDYGILLVDMVKSGKYDWKNDDITAEHFPITGNGKVELSLELVHLNKNVSSEVVLAHMEANGLRPATFAELLAFGAKYPEVQREFPIIVLGSSWVHRDGDRNVPCLGRYGSTRSLGLGWFDFVWDGYCRFLVVRKAS